LADVRRLAGQGYPVIVMPHWGDEYAPTAPDRVREKARELVAAGAFAIIGSHPHVIEDKEWIDNVPVIYSLGNLLFDQYFSPAVMLGNIAELTISKDESGTRIDSVRLYTVSKGSVISGEPIEFTR
jgi:poly-gamma-glutamate synthesis protein (capsule biosynthesis protein)